VLFYPRKIFCTARESVLSSFAATAHLQRNGAVLRAGNDVGILRICMYVCNVAPGNDNAAVMMVAAVRDIITWYGNWRQHRSSVAALGAIYRVA